MPYLKDLPRGKCIVDGFILSSGCMVPLDAKYENVRAMVNTAKAYYPHRS